jgi:hypothetical protein
MPPFERVFGINHWYRFYEGLFDQTSISHFLQQNREFSGCRYGTVVMPWARVAIGLLYFVQLILDRNISDYKLFVSIEQVITTNSSPLLLVTNFSTCSHPNFSHTRCARLLKPAIVTRNCCIPY